MNNHEQQQHVISTNEIQPLNSVREYSDSIPVDILIEIFLRVSSKSIARFRCVSKLWGSILVRPDFTELFMTRCPRILFIVNASEVFFSSPQHTNLDENSCVVASRYNSSVPDYVPPYYNTMLCGLVLRRGYKGINVCVICNHATGEFVTLPKVLFKVKTLPKVTPKIKRFLLGYDPISKQLKVLCMTSSSTHQVLTLENGKRKWRHTESKLDFMERDDIHGEICINGGLYFGPVFEGNSSVVCFDVRSEKFSIIKIGQDKVKEGPCTSERVRITLINYKGKLGILGTRGYFILDFDLLVLEDAGNHKWSKHSYEFPHNIVNGFMFQIVGMTGTGERVYANQLRIVGMTGTGEMLYAPFVCLSNPFYVFYYNLERNTFTRVDIQGFSPKNSLVRVFVDYGENMKLFK